MNNGSWKPPPTNDVAKCLTDAEKGLSYTQGRSGFASQLRALRRDFQVAMDAEITERALRLGLASLSAPEDTVYPFQVRLAGLNLVNHILNSATLSSVDQDLAGELYSSIGRAKLQDRPDVLLEHLRLVEIVAAKYGRSVPQDKLDLVVDKISMFCYYDSTASLAAPAAPRDRVSANGRTQMGTFVMPQRSATQSRHRPPRRQTSTSSLASNRSQSSDMEASDIENEQSRPKLASEIRQKALQCLTAIAKMDWKALHPHWGRFLGPSRTSVLTSMCEDPSIDVRIAAAQAVNALLHRSVGYFALARTDAIKPSFTTLSQNLAAKAIDINKGVARQLGMSTLSEQQLALLQLAETVSSNSPYEQLDSQLLADLLMAIAAKTRNSNLEVTDKANSALQAAITATTKSESLSDCTAMIVVEAAQKVFEAIKNQPNEELQLAAKLWQSLSILLNRMDAYSNSASSLLQEVLTTIESELLLSEPTMQAQQLAVLVSITGASSESAALELSARLSVHRCVRTALFLWDKGGKQSVPVANALAHLLRLNVDIVRLGQDDQDEALELVFTMAQNSSKTVRIHAYRAAGAILESSRGRQNRQLCDRLCRMLMKAVMEDKQPQAMAQAIWNLANIYDSEHQLGAIEVPAVELFERILALAQQQSRTKDAETTRISSIRVLGNLLSQTPSSLSAEHRRQSIDILIDALLHSWAKVQWNAAIALKRVITANDKRDPAIVDALIEVVTTDKNMKVRASALAAIEAVRISEDYPILKQSLEEALDSIDKAKSDLPFTEAAKAEQIKASIQALLGRLVRTALTAPVPQSPPTSRFAQLLREVEGPGI